MPLYNKIISYSYNCTNLTDIFQKDHLYFESTINCWMMKKTCIRLQEQENQNQKQKINSVDRVAKC